jgi:MFS family permease
MRNVFAQPGYRRLWSARTASQWGDVFATVALSLLVLDLTGSALGVSAVVAVEIIPVLLLAPFAGTLVDRLPRIPVMVTSTFMSKVPTLAIPLGSLLRTSVVLIAASSVVSRDDRRAFAALSRQGDTPTAPWSAPSQAPIGGRCKSCGS